MASRLELQALLESILGSKNVYFQAPPSNKMEYPCIIYQRDSAVTRFADDKPYNHFKRYQVMYISNDPEDDEVKDQLVALPMCVFDRFYTAENLNHDVYKLFF